MADGLAGKSDYIRRRSVNKGFVKAAQLAIRASAHEHR